MNKTLKICKETGLLTEVSYCPSPHQDDRPLDTIIDMIVVHCISLPPGEFGSNQVEAFFCGTLNTRTHAFFKEIESLRVSAHLFIKRSGEII
jgi:AmpD protein